VTRYLVLLLIQDLHTCVLVPLVFYSQRDSKGISVTVSGRSQNDLIMRNTVDMTVSKPNADHSVSQV
jgi:hypothetical protein